MYNRTLILILLLLATHACLCQQIIDPGVPRTFLKVTPQVLSHTIAVGVEHMNATQSKSIQLTGGYRYDGTDYRNGKGVNIELALRNYIEPFRSSDDSNLGIYYGLFVNGSYFEGLWKTSPFERIVFYDDTNGVVVDRKQVEIRSGSAGFTIGMQEIFRKAAAIDFYVGLGVRFVNLNSLDNLQRSRPAWQMTDPAFDGLILRAGLSFGLGI